MNLIGGALHFIDTWPAIIVLVVRISVGLTLRLFLGIHIDQHALFGTLRNYHLKKGAKTI